MLNSPLVDSQVNPRENPFEARESEATPRIENEGVDQTANEDPPGSSADKDDVAQEQVEDAEE